MKPAHARRGRAGSIPSRIRWCACWRAIPTARSRSSSACSEAGYSGGLTIVKDYVAKVRPARREAFLKLAFAPGECAQVDWGEYGSIAVGSTRRRLSFFVLVLAYSRRLYVQFTVSQKMEHFLACHEQAFAAIRRRSGQDHGRQPQVGGLAASGGLRAGVQRALPRFLPALGVRYRRLRAGTRQREGLRLILHLVSYVVMKLRDRPGIRVCGRTSPAGPPAGSRRDSRRDR